MLFKEFHLQGIKSRAITLAFRKWHKPCVKSGTLLHTSIGLIRIGRIETVNEKDITEEDALRAGFADINQLLKLFAARSSGRIFRIHVRFYSEDPRIKLREQTEQEFDELIKKIDSLDKNSTQGNWTKAVLLAISDNPNVHAIGIAKLTGFEKDWLKLNIRKMKNLGLTTSHTIGYELSPKGKVVLEILIQRK